MLAEYRKSNILQWLAIFTVAGFLNVTMPQALLASSLELAGEYEAADSVAAGLVFRGDLDFNKFSICSFVSRPLNVSVAQSTNLDAELFRVHDGMAEMYLPLATFGRDVRHPGIFYDHHQQGDRFHEYVARAVGEEASGQAGAGNGEAEVKESEQAFWPYLLGGALLVGGVALALDSGSDGGGGSEPPHHEDID